ncbi:hypothetical protein A2T55_04805 [Brevibacterium linens]|uniref:Uncharacterized protein n=1 Tax=Brevibacterium linens TaxID=1703 RepID=A0A142NK82_BRELN|nr:hypothetical protein A2T55_04805 [Brevibacterium linens]
MEVGFGYKTQYLPPAVDCDVSSKEAGWEDAKHTILTADTVALAIGVAILVVGIVFYVRQRRNTRSVSA